MRPRDPIYNALPLPEAPGVDAGIAYVIARSPISDPHTRYQQAEKMKRDHMIKNNQNYWVPWETIKEGNPQYILDRKEHGKLPPLLIMQGALDDNVLPAIQEKFVASYRAAGGAEVGVSAVRFHRGRATAAESDQPPPGLHVLRLRDEAPGAGDGRRLLERHRSRNRGFRGLRRPALFRREPRSVGDAQDGRDRLGLRGLFRPATPTTGAAPAR